MFYTEINRDIPEAIVALNQKKSNKVLFDSALLPESVINAPAILTELKDKRQ
jgi:hydrogenase-1 operon protein HyaF